MSTSAIKPRLRGYLHQEAFFIALGACIVLIAQSRNDVAAVALGIYSFGLLTLFGISAIYHRPHWEPLKRAWLKRADHCAIFLLIAGTMTPIALLALNEADGTRLLTIFWITAAVGVLQSLFWVKAPKWVTAILYVTAGWMAFPYLSELRAALGATSLSLVVAGGAVYTIGAVFYALKRPNFFPGIFGYHELFHLFTIVGAALHFAAIYRLT